MSERKSWSQHPRFHLSPAALLLSIHDSFREAMARLAVMHGAVRPMLFQRVATSLHHHHHAEEALLFPEVKRVSGVLPAELEADHEVLNIALRETGASFGTRQDADIEPLREILLGHLDREEALVIPVMLEHEDFRGP